ncbi:hypothetical protein [Fibrella aquatica]|uniref:hypothetical protein n=1 Tax=Fibrella aquatica TaxID=3242487 RepID=UPI00352230DC
MKPFLQQLHQVNPLLYTFGWVCLLGAGLCLALTLFTHTQVMGVNAWYKPMKFCLSTTLLVWTMGWFGQYLGRSEAVVAYSWGMIGLLGFEIVYIVLQAGRGQLSHFNLSTPLYAGLYSLMAIAATGASLWTGYIGFLLFRADLSALPRAYVWGIYWGIGLFVLFSMQGFAMGSRLTHTIGGPDGSPGLPIVNWSRRYGDLRIAHFLGMHALQVLPLLGFYVLRSSRWLVVVSLCYALFTAAIFWQALRGKPLLPRTNSSDQLPMNHRTSG